jgi:hypothetical protein
LVVPEEDPKTQSIYKATGDPRLKKSLWSFIAYAHIYHSRQTGKRANATKEDIVQDYKHIKSWHTQDLREAIQQRPGAEKLPYTLRLGRRFDSNASAHVAVWETGYPVSLLAQEESKDKSIDELYDVMEGWPLTRTNYRVNTNVGEIAEAALTPTTGEGVSRATASRNSSSAVLSNASVASGSTNSYVPSSDIGFY